MTANEFKTRYLIYHKSLYRLAYVMTSDARDAEDLLQDLYVKMWQIRDSLPEILNVEAFMATVLRRMHYDRMRAKSAKSISVSVSEIEDLPSAQDSAASVELREDCEALDEFIEQLGVKEREVIKLHLFEDKNYKEIGTLTGYTQSNIRVLVMRAKEKIKRQFIKRSEI